MSAEWLRKYKDIAERKQGHEKPAEISKEANDSGQSYNAETRKQELIHRRAAVESSAPREVWVSGLHGRPEIFILVQMESPFFS